MTTVMAETVVNMEESRPNINDQPDISDDDDDEDHSGEEGEGKGKGKKSGGKSRRELPSGAVATLKAWLLSPEHFTHPYPTPQDQIMLMQKTGIDKKQLKNWFTNARRRIWKPMLKKQLEQGKLAQAGGGPGGAGSVTILNTQGTVPGSAMLLSQQPVQPAIGPDGSHFHGQWQQQQSGATAQQYDASNAAPGPMPGYTYVTQYPQQFTNPRQQQSTQSNNAQQLQNGNQQQAAMNPSNSIGSLPPISSFGSSGQMIKNDSHAVLMELFARDQDLVRQAAEGAKLKSQQASLAPGMSTSPSHQCGSQDGVVSSNNVGPLSSQHPMQSTGGSIRVALGGATGSVPTLNSWPHFSSVSSLNNLGSLAGVKSIQNLSAADLATQAGKRGSLAQIKSQESMGRADSYAFLEVFFDSEMANRRGMKRERDEDNDIGLSLDADEPSAGASKGPEVVSSLTRPAPMPSGGVDENEELKRNYDDALAARGLLSVSRSRERLNEIPKKMQRTLSQEYLKQFAGGGWSLGSLRTWNPTAQHQMIEQEQHQSQDDKMSQQMQDSSWSISQTGHQVSSMTDTGVTNDSVEVPVSTKCSICHQVNIDTQLLPCGHMFHGRCLKPSLQNAMGPPTCPVDHIPMQSAVLAVPTGGNCRPPNGPPAS